MQPLIRWRSIKQGALLLAGLLAYVPGSQAEVIPVELRKTEQGWQLERGGEPYFIRGAGGAGSLPALKAAGANSLRTWGDDASLALLDAAHALGLSVTVGIWLGHERHGFDYRDRAQVEAQLAAVRDKVLRFKDHPAVLLWGVGNEAEGFAEGNDPVIWAAINEAAELVKSLDPHHPTMTVTAYVHGERIEYLHRKSPAIDIHGINAYGGGTGALVRHLREGGATKPFVLAEFGPVGPWEAEKTDWAAPLEETSTDKANTYRRSYQDAVAAAQGMSLGGYAFLWGNKMEATETWFGMFLDDGSRLASIETMTRIWGGQLPSNLAPTLEPLKILGETAVEPGSVIQVTTQSSDPESEPLTAHWALKGESGEILTGGDFRPNPPTIDGAVIESELDSAKIRMPDAPGAYRVFYFVHDASGNAATANLPVLVQGEPKTRMPFPVYEERFEQMPWVPSGWMGGVDKLSVDGDSHDKPYEGESAIRIRYEGTFGWAGVAWQHPPNNWGEQDGGYNLEGATELELWARGEYGGERVSFGVGLIDASKDYPDSGIHKVDDIVLTPEWQRYSVPVASLNLSSIKTGLVVTVNGRRTPVTVHLDNIRFTR